MGLSFLMTCRQWNDDQLSMDRQRPESFLGTMAPKKVKPGCVNLKPPGCSLFADFDLAFLGCFFGRFFDGLLHRLLGGFFDGLLGCLFRRCFLRCHLDLFSLQTNSYCFVLTITANFVLIQQIRYGAPSRHALRAGLGTTVWLISLFERPSLSRISSAFRSFFSILFSGILPEDIAQQFGYEKPKPAPVPVEQPKPADGALQLLQILQRDSRLIDFLMEDIESYSDDQIGAAVRALHADSRATLMRHVTLNPVLDSVEGTFQKMDVSKAPDPNRIKLIGNVPASGKVPGGTLRHRGWMVSSINLPPLGRQDPKIIAPAELEIE
jgi:hypothetical protein